MQNKTREELVEVCFQALLEVKVARGELISPTAASATESFKKKLENKPREELVTMCFDALKERQALQQQNKRKVLGAELTDEGEHKKPAPHATRDEGQTGQRKRRVLQVRGAFRIRKTQFKTCLSCMWPSFQR